MELEELMSERHIGEYLAQESQEEQRIQEKLKLLGAFVRCLLAGV